MRFRNSCQKKSKVPYYIFYTWGHQILLAFRVLACLHFHAWKSFNFLCLSFNYYVEWLRFLYLWTEEQEYMTKQDIYKLLYFILSMAIGWTMQITLQVVFTRNLQSQGKKQDIIFKTNYTTYKDMILKETFKTNTKQI